MFLSLAHRQKKITNFLQAAFLRILFPSAERAGGNYGAEKMTKMKLVRVLITSFD